MAVILILLLERSLYYDADGQAVAELIVMIRPLSALMALRDAVSAQLTPAVKPG
jgi:hypothetical protein